MAMGTNNQHQQHTQGRTRAAKPDAAVQGIVGAVFALIAVMFFASATTWYSVVGACIAVIAAVAFVARAVLSLRLDDVAPFT
jgi:hypothetical protein